MKISSAALFKPALFAAALNVAGLAASAQAQEPPAAAPPAVAPATAAPVVPAAPKADAADDAVVRALLAQMAKAHAALTAFSATMTFSVDENGKVLTQKSQIAYQKPNKIRVTTKNPLSGAEVMSISNGKTLFQTVSTDKGDYHKAAAPADTRAFTQVLGAAKSGGIGLFPVLAADPNAEKEVLPPGSTSLVRSPDDTVDGVPVEVVTITFGPTADKQATLVFSIGKNDHLLRRLRFVQPAPDGKKLTLEETYSDIKINPDLPAALFVFTPAPGAKVIVETAEAAPQSVLPYDARLKKGVAPLPFTGKDLAGNPVSLAAYKGKVVLLDFWATWCAPCREEVPNLVKNYNKYHAKGFEIVGVSLDQKGDKAKLVSYTKQNKMPWRQIFDGEAGGAIANTYGVQTIPFSVLIGRDGKILAVGNGIRGASLEPAIKAALAAK